MRLSGSVRATLASRSVPHYDEVGTVALPEAGFTSQSCRVTGPSDSGARIAFGRLRARRRPRRAITAGVVDLPRSGRGRVVTHWKEH